MPIESNKIRVAIITTVHDPNDTRIYYRQMTSLINAGYEVFYLCKEIPKTSNGATVIKLPSFTNKYFRTILAPLVALWKSIRLKNIAVYHFHDPELIITGLLLKIFRKKVIYDVHEDLPKQLLSNDWIPKSLLKPISIFANLVEKASARFFDKIIAVTAPIAERFQVQKTIIVQNFPSKNELIADNSTSYKNRYRRIIYVGEASEIRGLRELVKALELVENVRLTFIGRISSKGLESELRTYKGWGKVDFLGAQTRKEVAKYLGQSRIGIVCFYPEPNHIEAQPNKLFEYMSVGIPVVASNFPKWQEIVDKYKTGLSVNPFSVQETADAIRWLLDNEDEAIKMGINGRTLISTTYSWENEEVQLIKCYSDLLKAIN
ncbi:glycosyltransferase [bacterium]|nr:MAG: glycosyltransferase [bacterium]